MRSSEQAAGAGGLAGVDTSTPAVVLKFDQNMLHHGGLGAIRSLGRIGVPVYGVHEQPWAPAAGSRYLHGRWVWQPDAGDTERTTAGLRALAGRLGRPAVLIPTDDAGAIFLAEHGDPLRDAFLFPAPPADLPRRLAGKFSMHELCGELGMTCPRVALPGSLEAAREFTARAGYPVVAKLAAPWSAAGAGLRSTSIIGGDTELASLWQDSDRAGARLMLQEFIPAGPGDDWFFHGYCDAGSICRPGFTGVKVRSYPAEAGLTSFGRAVPNERLRAGVTSLLARLSYHGIVDLDLRRDARDGEYKLLDFNPRLGAQFRLFRDSAGLDVVLAAYLDLTGQQVPAGAQLDGRGFLVENYDPLGALGYWRRGKLGLRPWLASLRQVDEVAWFARDDLRPFGLMCLRMGVRAVTRRAALPSAAAHGAAARDTATSGDLPGPAAGPRYLPGRAGRRTRSGPRPHPGGHPATSQPADRAAHGCGAAGAAPIHEGNLT